jgi:hypothetical protein
MSKENINILNDIVHIKGEPSHMSHKKFMTENQLRSHKKQITIPVANISTSRMQVYASLQELL